MDEDGGLLRSVLAEGLVQTVYQPLVELDTGLVCGYEALSRGPEGSQLKSPDHLFAVARAHGRVVELDRLCREKAIIGAAALGHNSTFRLFVNAEASAVDEGGLGLIGDVAERLGLSVVLELTERDLVADPARLLKVVEHVRRRGWGIALDDVGAEPASLALLPLVRPDVIKLDLRLVQVRPDRDIARVMNAVHAEAERSGASVLAEGIETDRHVEIARSLGATLGQGFLFGRPGPLPDVLPAAVQDAILVTHRAPRADGESAYAVAGGQRTPRTGRKALLIEISKLLEAQAADEGATALVLSAFQSAAFFTPGTATRYANLHDQVAFIAALGVRMPIEPVPGVRGAVLDPDDVLTGEWDVAVLSPHFAAALVARDLGDQDLPDNDRRFDFVLTHDRPLVAEIAGILMSRIVRDPRATKYALFGDAIELQA